MRLLKAEKSRNIQDENINAYKLQADSFAESVLDGKPPRFPYEDIINNIRAVNGSTCFS